MKSVLLSWFIAIVMFFVFLGMFIWEMVNLSMPPSMRCLYLLANGLLWYSTSSTIVTGSWKPAVLTVMVAAPMLWHTFAIMFPGTAAGAELTIKVKDQDNYSAALASNIKKYRPQPCDSMTFWGNHPQTHAPTALAGYVIKNNRYQCYDISLHLNSPGVDVDGAQIMPVTLQVIEAIKAQLDRDKATLHAAQEATIAATRKAAERAARAEQRAAAALQEQRRAQQTPEPVTVVVPTGTPVPEKICASTTDLAMYMMKRFDIGKTPSISLPLQETLEDLHGRIIVNKDTPVKVTVADAHPEPNGVTVFHVQVEMVTSNGQIAREYAFFGIRPKGRNHFYVTDKDNQIGGFRTVHPICTTAR